MIAQRGGPRGSLPPEARSKSLASISTAVFALALAGCGGAMPLAHPAHVLPAGKATVGAGVSGLVLGSSTASVLDPGAAQLQNLTVAPGVAPWAAARAGLGNGFEAGLGLSTRAVRLDARRSFESDRLALSIGFGASAIFGARPGSGPQAGEPSGHGAAEVFGGGFDVPVLVGWRSSADLYAIWAGPRFGAELLSGKLDVGEPAQVSASGRHLHVGGVLGLRAGFRHLYGVLEAEVAYQCAAGSIGVRALSLEGWSVAPSGALVVSF